MPTLNIQIPEDKVSFAPIILLYEEENRIFTAYKRIIIEYEQQFQTLRTVKRAIKFKFGDSSGARNKGYSKF
jgi:DNA helicase II / ATP-dependent DNA helicase PcrA